MILAKKVGKYVMGSLRFNSQSSYLGFEKSDIIIMVNFDPYHGIIKHKLDIF